MQLTGTVVTGAGRGKAIGTPTLNIQPPQSISIEPGIYAGYAQLDDKPEQYRVAVHIGERPVFNDTFSYEVHCIDTTIDFEVQTVTVDLEHFLRPVVHFDSVEDLQAQIQQDILDAKALL